METAARRGSAALLAACAALFMTACGGDPKTEAGAEDTVEEYVAAFVKGDDDGCELLTEDYAESLVDDWNEDGFGDEEAESCEDVIEQGAFIAELFGADDVEIADLSTEVDGDEATVEVEYDGSDTEGETYQLVYEDGDWLIDGEEGGDAEVEDVSGDEPEPTEEESTPVAAPSAVGDLVTVGSWDVRVVGIERDADGAMVRANSFNDPPDEQYLLVTFEATYTGSERSGDIEFDLTWSLTSSEQQVLDEDSQVTPSENESWPTEARAGGTVQGQAVFDVDPALVDGGLLTVESDNEEFETEYVDFAL